MCIKSQCCTHSADVSELEKLGWIFYNETTFYRVPRYISWRGKIMDVGLGKDPEEEGDVAGWGISPTKCIRGGMLVTRIVPRTITTNSPTV
jgi:hypothetical protein